MPFSFFDSSNILKELFLENRISADEYLSAVKRTAIVAGFFMVIGFVLVDYFLLPKVFRDGYSSFGFYWSAPVAIILSFLIYLIGRRKARGIIERQESD